MLNGRYETNTKLPEILIGFVFFLQRVPPICLAEFGRFYWILLHKFYENFRGLSAQSFLTDTIPVSAINIFSFFSSIRTNFIFFSRCLIGLSVNFKVVNLQEICSLSSRFHKLGYCRVALQCYWGDSTKIACKVGVTMEPVLWPVI